MKRHSMLSAAVLSTLCLALPLGAQQSTRDTYLAFSDSTRGVAERYQVAYVGLDWDAIEGMLADSASFQDPTAEQIFGGVLVSGREAMMVKFRQGYAGIEMSYTPTRSFFSGQHAVFEGNLTWSAPVQGGGRVASKDAPFVLVLKVVDGKVVEHRDFTDYHPFIAAMDKLD